MDFHSYDPAAGHGLRHDPLNAIVAPRPIGWIGTVSPDGTRNLAPYSFFNLFNYAPPIIGFCSQGRKDSVRNAEATGEFVWNLATRPLAEAMNATSAATPDDEYALAGLKTLPSTQVRPERVQGSPVHFECRLTQVVQLRDAGGGALDQWLVLGQAVAIHIDRRLIADGVYRTTLAQPITRGGGPADYFEVREDALFRMPRPGAARP